MRRNKDTEFKKFGQVPLEGNVRFWKESGTHREPIQDSYQQSIKLNGHNIVFANPNNFDTIVACVNCKRGVEVEEVPILLRKYILGYFYEHDCM